ncbi:MAG: EAL domain-containing response regulator [Gallionella sp.]
MTKNPAIRILVLDDYPFMLKVLAHMLKHLGYTSVATCNNGRAALEMVDNSNDGPDLILLDLNMPEMDGVEFVRHLVEHRYAGSLILISGEDAQMLLATEKLVRAHNIPVLGHLSKPVRPEDLAALIDLIKPESLTSLIHKLALSNHADTQPVRLIYSAEDVRAAMANGELVNYYQPKVSPVSGQVVGVETMVRWDHPRNGIVFPSRFIGVAEEYGLIKNLTWVVLTGALNQFNAWQKEGLSLQVSVNVSIHSLVSVDFVGFIAGLVSDAGVPPEMVVLEVPESLIMMNDLRAPLETLTRLRLKGFRLSIDAFGVGYFSQERLRDLPFNEIKIDRSCVHHASTNKKVREKYDACLGMARQLDLDVVAVGVEETGDWDMLRNTRCDIAQGYFIAKPMPASDLPGWIQSWASKGLV